MDLSSCSAGAPTEDRVFKFVAGKHARWPVGDISDTCTLGLKILFNTRYWSTGEPAGKAGHCTLGNGTYETAIVAAG